MKQSVVILLILLLAACGGAGGTPPNGVEGTQTAHGGLAADAPGATALPRGPTRAPAGTATRAPAAPPGFALGGSL